MELVKGTFFEVSGINCSIENPSFVTAVISVAQFRFSRPCGDYAGTVSVELCMLNFKVSNIRQFRFLLKMKMCVLCGNIKLVNMDISLFKTHK
jgi:hypothetical protein